MDTSSKIRCLGTFVIILLLAAGHASPAGATTAAAPIVAQAATTAPTVAAPALPTGPVEIVFWGFTLPAQVTLIDGVMKAYSAKHPNVKFTVDNLSYNDLHQKLLVAMGTGTGPDMFTINTGWLPPYVAKNNLAALSPQLLGYASLEAVKDAYLQGTITPFIRDGKLIALPSYLYPLGLFINTAHFKEAGLDPDKNYPKTWEEALAVGKKLTKTQGGRITRQGFRFTFLSPTWTQYIYEPLIRQFGGDTLGADGKCTMNSPAGVKAMDVLASFSRQKVMDPNVSVATPPFPTLDFVKDVASMEPAHPNTIQFIRANNQAMWASKGFKIVPLPQADPKNPVNLLAGNVFAINAASSPDKIAVATDLTRELVAKPGDWLSKVGGLSPLKATATTAEAREFPFLSVFLDDMKYGRVPTWSPHSAVIADAEFRALQAVVLNNVNSKTALDQACQQVNRALGF